MSLANSLKQTNSFYRFLLVGVVNTLIGLSSMFILLKVGWTYWFATFIGNSIGAFVSYHLNRSFTFRSSTPFSDGALKFIIVILISYTFSYSVSVMIAGLLSIPEALSYLVSNEELGVLMGTFFYTVTNYFGQKIFVFNKRSIKANRT